jgi:hypothetical protein
MQLAQRDRLRDATEVESWTTPLAGAPGMPFVSCLKQTSRLQQSRFFITPLTVSDFVTESFLVAVSFTEQ